MDEIKFKIFTKNKWCFLSLNIIFFILFIIFYLILHFNSENKLLFLEQYLIPYFILLVFSIFLLNFTSFFRTEPLKGQINGLLTLNKNFIQVNSKMYPIENIQQLKFSISDFKGYKKHTSKISIDGRLSNGVDNTISIIF